MAELTNLRIVESLADELNYGPDEVISRERLNRSVKGLQLDASDINFLASRMGVQPGTVKGWLSPTSKSEIIPKSMVGQNTLGGGNITAEWRNRAILGLALTGELASTDPRTGQQASFNDKATGSLETVFKRLSSYTGYGLSNWENGGWRGIKIGQNKWGNWVINVTYERIGSPGEAARQANQGQIDFDEEEGLEDSLNDDWGSDDEAEGWD